MTEAGRAMLQELTEFVGKVHERALEDTGRISRGLFDVWPLVGEKDETKEPAEDAAPR